MEPADDQDTSVTLDEAAKKAFNYYQHSVAEDARQSSAGPATERALPLKARPGPYTPAFNQCPR